jgi:membrane protease YdiL (CAAX protease family)
MGSPIAHSVDQALQRARKAGDDRRPPSHPASLGTAWLYFVVITISLSWLTAAAMGGPWLREDAPLVTRLLWASLYYAVVMGWQPLVGAWLARAVRNEAPRPSPVRAPRARFLGVAAVLAIVLALISMVVARLLGEDAPAPGLGSLSRDTAVAAAGVFAILCLQAFTEELGWRGFPLTCAVRRWGGRGGLILHGVAWGAWYAPLFLVSAGVPFASLPIAAAFAVTCLLLGIVFGWLRLWSGSVVPSAVANALLTIIGGLPLLAIAGSRGSHDAVFRWPGWFALGALAIGLLIWRRRDLTAHLD